MSVMVLVYAIFAGLVLILNPSDALAWGPGMHVETALMALSNIGLIAPVIAGLIKRYPDAFIYGSASPDIIVGKKYAGYLHHCHNWRMGKLILKEAKSDTQKAAAYGYLMHLAADIVAHNYYIPVKIVRSYSARLLSHTYWEMRFDLGVGEESWDRLKMVTGNEIEEFDDLLERVLRKTLFSFSTNKRIFNTILILQKMKTLRMSLALYAKHSRYGIAEENRGHYLDLTREAIFGFLSHPDDADCLNVDPAGLAKLDYAKKLRKKMRRAYLNGVLSRKRADNFVEFVKERMAVGLYRPEMVLPDISDAF